MSEYTIFAKRIGLVGVANIAVGLQGLILLPILTKMLGASGYGIWSQLMVTISLITPLAVLGLTQSMARFVSSKKDIKDVQEVFYSISFTVLFASLILSTMLFLISESFAVILLKDISIVLIIKVAAFVITLDALDRTTRAFFTASMQLKIYSVFLILRTCVEVGLIAYAVLSGFGIFGAVIALVTSRVILLLVMISYIISKIGFKLPNFSKVQSYLRFGLPMVPAVMFAWIIHSSDRYMIGYFMGSAPVGIYAAAYNIGFVIHMFLNPIGIVLFPTLSKLWDEKKIVKFKTYLIYSLKYYLMIAIPSIFGLSVLADELLSILSTPEFSSGAILVPFITSGVVLYGVYSIFHYVLTSAKRTDLIAISLGISSVINITLNILFIPKLGLSGAAIATLITYSFTGVVVLFLSYKYVKFEIDWVFILKNIVASLVMASLIILFDPSGLLEVMVVIVCGALLYFIILFMLKSFNDEETKIFKERLHIK